MQADHGRHVYGDILQAIGRTPLVRLNKVTGGARTPVWAKCEFMNPGGSVKDRIGIAIIEDAERAGHLKPGGTIVEGTSGNTGIGLALAASIKGYHCIFTIPDKMSIEKVKLMKAFGAEVVVTPTVGPEHPDYYVTVAKKLAERSENAILANQFYNQANPEAHYRTTGPELWEQTEGRITHLVGGMGTGGTMSGSARYLRERNPGVRIIGADPVGSMLAAAKHGEPEETGPYKVEGIGNDKVPGTCHLDLFDEVRRVTDKDAFMMTRRLTREEGLFAGGSAGLAVVTALQVAREADDPNGCVVVILPSTGERYLSKVHSDEWMRENRFLGSEETSARDLVLGRSHDERLVYADPGHSVRQALALMAQHGITQLPILEDGECVGSVSESSLLSQAIEDKASLDRPVIDLKDPPFPVVNGDSPFARVAQLLQRSTEAVLVRDQSGISGIVTRSDMLEHLSAG